MTFQSHVDGATVALSPERAIEVQCLLGSDIQMVLDECTPHPATREEAKASLELSLRWAKRCKVAFASMSKPGQALFGIVQGSVYPDLRVRCARDLIELGFDGYAVGGLAVGEGQEAMLEMVETTTTVLPEDRPRYLMGVGTPGGSARLDRPWHRHVRLRAADALRPPLPGFHLGRPAQSAQRPLRRGSDPARSREFMSRRAI